MNTIINSARTGWIMALLLLASFLSMVVIAEARAEGGKVGKISTSPVFSADAQPAGLVVNVPEGCVIVPAQSQVVVWCPGDD